jgi:hypothetical protein
LLLPQLASQGINLTAFLQPMVQMVASLSAKDSSSSSAAGGTIARLAGMGSSVGAGAGEAYTAADAATLLMQQGPEIALVGTAGQIRYVAKSRVPLFSPNAQLAAQEQLATATAEWSAAAAGTGGDRCRTAAPASTTGVGAAAAHDAAAHWDQASELQHQSSSTLTGVVARATAAQEPAVLNNQQQQGKAQQQQVQQAVIPASPHMQQQQQQAQMQLQQGSWMSSSSSSAVSSSAAGGAALGGLMSPSSSITGHLLSPAAAAAAAAHRQLQQVMAVTPVQASQGSLRQWQCSSSAVPSYTAGAEAQAAAAAGATGSVVPHATAALLKSSQHPAQQAAAHAAGLARSEATRAGSIADKGAVQYGQRVERAAPGPADSQVINQHRQHILTLEQSLGNMHPQVRQLKVSA